MWDRSRPLTPRAEIALQDYGKLTQHVAYEVLYTRGRGQEYEPNAGPLRLARYSWGAAMVRGTTWSRQLST